jgi:hypothetical protein
MSSNFTFSDNHLYFGVYFLVHSSSLCVCVCVCTLSFLKNNSTVSSSYSPVYCVAFD